jgi:hypothetical protein
MPKQLYIAILSVFISVINYAQIPNTGFEAWTNNGAYETPDNWDNLNQMTNNSGIYTCIKGTPGYSGTSYLFLSSKAIAGKGIIPGIAICGKIDTVTYKPKSGFQFALRPQYLSYYMQYMPADPADSSNIKVLLTKWNSSLLQRDTVAFGASYFNGMAHSWFNNGTFLNYKSGENPDSAIIVISSSSSVPKNGSYIYVDNLQFIGNVVGINEYSLNSNTISVFPNPSSDIVNIGFNSNHDKASTLMIFDFSGNLIYKTRELNKSNTINTSQWSKGIYTIQVNSNNQSINKKLIIN